MRELKFMIEMNEYAKRRKTLMQKIGPDSLVIISSAKEVSRNGDALYPFRQNSDFFYLTGFNEPDAVLVLSAEKSGFEYILFNRKHDKEHEIWDGPRAGLEGAVKLFLADRAYPIEEFENKLTELMIGKKSLHYLLGVNLAFDNSLMRAFNNLRKKLRGGMKTPMQCIDITPSLHEMRLIKNKAEIAAIQKAIDITADGFLNAMRAARPQKYEYEIEALLTYAFVRQGAKQHAYSPIVGSGANSCILHYIANNKLMVDGDILLIDAGAEYNNYAADITRTFPVNGKFQGEQKAIYELVLAAQLAAIKAVKPGVSWMAMQVAIVKVLTQGLVDLGILKGNVDNLIEKKAYFPFYMHRSGHWLGLDVHDVGYYTEGPNWRPFSEGMVFTVEPGLYLSADISNLPQRWHNIGVRIEDDVVVTKEGYKVLSAHIPKAVGEIEDIMKSSLE